MKRSRILDEDDQVPQQPLLVHILPVLNDPTSRTGRTDRCGLRWVYELKIHRLLSSAWTFRCDLRLEPQPFYPVYRNLWGKRKIVVRLFLFVWVPCTCRKLWVVYMPAVLDPGGIARRVWLGEYFAVSRFVIEEDCSKCEQRDGRALAWDASFPVNDYYALNIYFFHFRSLFFSA